MDARNYIALVFQLEKSEELLKVATHLKGVLSNAQNKLIHHQLPAYFFSSMSLNCPFLNNADDVKQIK